MKRLGILSLCFLGACGGATPGPVGAPSVRVRHYTDVVSYEQPVLSDAKIRDERGELLAEGLVLIVEREHEIEKSRTDLLVGGEPVDEIQFYRVAGDDEAVRILEGRRRGPRWAVRAGIALLGVGAVGLAGSVPLGIAEGRPAGIVSSLVGGTFAGYGFLLWTWGTSRLEDERRVIMLPEERARAAARQWTVESGR